MRRLAAFALVLLLASPAGAQGGKLRLIQPPTAAEAGLKGAEPKAEEPEPETPSYDFALGAQPVTAVTRPLTNPVPVDASQCRLRCAQSRYFCLADTDEETCSPQWAMCVARCS